MNDGFLNSTERDRIEQAAAHWVLRRDHGLTASEQDEYSQWLASDPRHREAMARQRWAWEELDRLAGLQSSMEAVPDPDLLAAKPRSFFPVVRRFAPWAALPIAALLVFGFFFSARKTAPAEMVDAEVSQSVVLRALTAPIEQRVLEDGSVVTLNRGAELAVDFTPAQRRLTLLRGEASFSVAKNPARPFIVNASGVNVLAVGTVFNVRLGSTAVEVLVTEGKVRVDKHAGEDAAAEAPVVAAGHYAAVAFDSSAMPPQVVALTELQIQEHLAWQPRVLDFSGTPLTEVVATFNQHNGVKLAIDDPALQGFCLSGSFRSDNLEGFVRLMKSDFGLYVEWNGRTELILRKGKPSSGK
jgi:transmembrane sensor